MKTLDVLDISLRSILYSILGLVVLGAPWFFGCVETWMVFAVVTLIFVASLIASVILFIKPLKKMPALDFLILALFFLFLVVIQQVDWPAKDANKDSVRNSLSADALGELNQLILAQPVASNLLKVSGVPRTTMSVAPAATRESLVIAISFYSVILGLLICQPSDRAIRLLSALVFASCLLLAFRGIELKAEGSRLLLGIYESRYGGNVFASFTNRNHFAALGNMVVGIGLFSFGPIAFSSIIRFRVEHGVASTISSKLHAYALLAGPLCLLIALILLAGSSLMTFSRGGFISFCLAFIVVGAFATYRERLPKLFAAAICMVMVVFFIAVFSLSDMRALERADELVADVFDPTADARTIVTSDTLDIFKDYPLLGAGLGTFQYLYPIYQDERVRDGRFLHAHNDWVQYISETGLVGGLLLIGGLLVLARALREVFQSEDLVMRIKTYGLLFSLVAIGFHSVFDYSLHKLPVLLTLAFIVGLLLVTREQHRLSVERSQVNI